MKQRVQVPRIKRMSALLANQIAAGEVVERPASVVKELVENALDAGATRIDVEIEKAGSSLIRIIDNGHGIHPDDLDLSLQRHATAKLYSEEDLLDIHSLGFRGEALPSISSVSELAIISRIAGKEEALRVHSIPGAAVETAPAAHPVGTTVEVRALFSNTPARKKYLRSEKTELLHIQETVRRLALCRPDFSIRLRHNGRQLFSCQANMLIPAKRITAVMGSAFTQGALAVDEQAGDMRLRGWLGLAEQSRSSTDRQYLFLNGRVIHDRRINHAVRVASETLLPPGRYPAYVLFLDMQASAADVNVHPAKHEVRFRCAGDVHDFVYAALTHSLAQQGPPETQTDTRKATVSGWDPRPGPEHPGGHAGSPRFSAPGVSDTHGGKQTAWGEILGLVSASYLLTRRQDAVVILDLAQIKRHLAARQLEDETKKPRERPLLVPVIVPLPSSVEAHFEQFARILAGLALELELAGPNSCRLRSIPHLLEQADLSQLLDDIFRVRFNGRTEGTIRQELIDIMLEHLDDVPETEVDLDRVRLLLLSLANSVEDCAKKHQAPLWFELDESGLKKLLRGAC